MSTTKVKLSLLERLQLAALNIPTGNRSYLAAFEEIKESMQPTEEETIQFNIRPFKYPNGQTATQINNEGNEYVIEHEFTELETLTLKHVFAKLDKMDEFPAWLMPLSEQIEGSQKPQAEKTEEIA